MEEKDIIELTEKEAQDVLTREGRIEQYNSALGVLRRQYLNAENELLEKIQQAETEYVSFLKFVFQNKNIGDMSTWRFDSVDFVFKKK